MRRKLAAGNWKMNGLSASIAELEALIEGAGSDPDCDVLICPPATLITRFAERAGGTAIAIGGQDCHAEAA
ncbi:MAG TPA: triose-phosphate isomerase, partial [Paracoccaceae bacterium]|nr:triose-phosphate isomerase [Paracoccaceae bacterium]